LGVKQINLGTHIKQNHSKQSRESGGGLVQRGGLKADRKGWQLKRPRAVKAAEAFIGPGRGVTEGRSRECPVEGTIRSKEENGSLSSRNRREGENESMTERAKTGLVSSPGI